MDTILFILHVEPLVVIRLVYDSHKSYSLPGRKLGLNYWKKRGGVLDLTFSILMWGPTRHSHVGNEQLCYFFVGKAKLLFIK